MTESKSRKIKYFIFVTISVFSILALYSLIYTDYHISEKIFNSHKNFEKMPGRNLIKAVGKCYVPLWLIFLWGFWKKRIEIILTGAISLLLVLAVVSPAKVIFNRERPEVYFESQSSNVKQPSYFYGLHVPSSQSFPSGDTATVFAAVVAAAPFVSSFSFFNLLLIASAVGCLRVLDLAHYPSDVFAGAAIGILCGWLGMVICEKWMKRNKFPFGQGWRKIAAIGIFLIPTLVAFKGFQDFSTFLLSSIVIAGCFCLAASISPMLKLAVMKFSNPAKSVDKSCKDKI
jgi:membrane-associated phospholipid phosphatase